MSHERVNSTLQAPAGFTPRRWATQAHERFLHHEGTDFLVNACPGSGKTKFAAMVAREALQQGRVDRVDLVGPSSHICQQWLRELAGWGIHLDPENARESADCQGRVMTYQRLGMSPESFRLCDARRTLVILDEIHHAGDARTWGDALRHAFQGATRRLLLSGTPFRRGAEGRLLRPDLLPSPRRRVHLGARRRGAPGRLPTGAGRTRLGRPPAHGPGPPRSLRRQPPGGGPPPPDGPSPQAPGGRRDRLRAGRGQRAGPGRGPDPDHGPGADQRHHRRCRRRGPDPSLPRGGHPLDRLGQDGLGGGRHPSPEGRGLPQQHPHRDVLPPGRRPPGAPGAAWRGWCATPAKCRPNAAMRSEPASRPS